MKENKAPLPSLEAALAESMYSIFTDLMGVAVLNTITDIRSPEDLESIKSFFDRASQNGLSTFFSPVSIELIASDVSQKVEIRNFVLSLHHRFVMAVVIAEMQDLFQQVKDSIIKFAGEAHHEDSLLQKAVAFSEYGKSGDVAKIIGVNSWLVVLYLCLSFGSFQDTFELIGSSAA